MIIEKGSDEENMNNPEIIENDSDSLTRIKARLKMKLVSPYILIHESCRQLIEGDYLEAQRLLDYASTLQGKFYEKGSAQDMEYSQLIHALDRIMIIMTEMRNLSG